MKRGTPDHPKVLMLAAELRRLGIPMPRVAAIGILEMLWQWAARYAIQGDIGRWPDEIIESALEWSGEPGALLDALIRTRWVDEVPEPHRLVIHDIHDHADNTWRQCLEDAGLTWWDGRPARREKPGRPRGRADSAREPQGPNTITTPAKLARNSSQTRAKLQPNSRETPHPEPEPEPEPEPTSAARKLPNTPLTPQESPPPPLTPVENPVEISRGASRVCGDGESPPLTDPRSVVPILAERRAMEPRQRRAPPQPRDEAGLAIAVVARMLCDWMEHRAETLGPPDEALCRRLLEAHGMCLERLRDWLLGLRRRGKHPSSIQSWGWFVTLAEADMKRTAEAVAEAAAAGGVA